MLYYNIDSFIMQSGITLIGQPTFVTAGINSVTVGKDSFQFSKPEVVDRHFFLKLRVMNYLYIRSS